VLHSIHPIHHLIEPLLRLVWPPTGSRRTARPTREPGRAVRDLSLVAHTRREEARLRRLRRARRRALWCAVHGIDLGPRLIHGVEVTA
jgi:hypothetical protein